MGSPPNEEGLSAESLSEAENKKCCFDCKATRTPCWRYGPLGPKTLCNACGLRYRKSTRHGLKKGRIGKAEDEKIMKPLKMNVMFPLEKELLNKGLLPMKKQRSPRQWGHVERAALLLMDLSRGGGSTVFRS